MLPQQKIANTADAANRVTQIGAVSYTFDDLGQTVGRSDSQGTTQFAWDARGRLTQANLPNGQTLRYSYDALGRRTSRTANNVTTSFQYDGQDVVLDRASDGATVDYLNGVETDEKLRQTSSNGDSLYFLQDHLGSVKALTDSAGNIVERKTYEAFGASGNGSLTRYGFTGREQEDATGTIYYRARWYDPQQGRFISEDPIGFDAGINWYTYVENDPVASNDPSGLRPLPRSRTGTRPCKPDEMSACVVMCGAKGVQSCRVSQTFRIVRQRDGKALWKWADGPLSCSCNDCEPEKERQPKRHPLNQPTMDELRMRQESAEQMYEFWKKVTIGGYLVGVVLTGGALLGPGAGAGALVPALAP